jgi:hypothetical protein
MQTVRNKGCLQKLALRVVTLVAVAFWVCGCARAPSFNILGSFFPAWLLCIIVGSVVAAAFYGLFVRLQLEAEIRPGIVVYPCLAFFCAFSLWLIFFR